MSTSTSMLHNNQIVEVGYKRTNLAPIYRLTPRVVHLSVVRLGHAQVSRERVRFPPAVIVASPFKFCYTLQTVNRYRVEKYHGIIV